MSVKLKMKSVEEIIRERDMENGGAVARYIDSECIRLMEPYTPLKDKDLILSAVETAVGSRVIKQGGPSAPYARRWYYTPAKFNGAPKRGNRWFQRMLDEGGRKEIMAGIELMTGAKFK